MATLGTWFEYGKTWWDFKTEGLNRPGVQIEVGDRVYLIGDINVLGGACNDWKAVGAYDVVLRYCILVRP